MHFADIIIFDHLHGPSAKYASMLHTLFDLLEFPVRTFIRVRSCFFLLHLRVGFSICELVFLFFFSFFFHSCETAAKPPCIFQIHYTFCWLCRFFFLVIFSYSLVFFIWRNSHITVSKHTKCFFFTFFLLFAHSFDVYTKGKKTIHIKIETIWGKIKNSSSILYLSLIKLIA